MISAYGFMCMLMEQSWQAGMYSYSGSVEHDVLAAHTYARFGQTSTTCM